MKLDILEELKKLPKETPVCKKCYSEKDKCLCTEEDIGFFSAEKAILELEFWLSFFDEEE